MLTLSKTSDTEDDVIEHRKSEAADLAARLAVVGSYGKVLSDILYDRVVDPGCRHAKEAALQKWTEAERRWASNLEAEGVALCSFTACSQDMAALSVRSLGAAAPSGKGNDSSSQTHRTTALKTSRGPVLRDSVKASIDALRDRLHLAGGRSLPRTVLQCRTPSALETAIRAQKYESRTMASAWETLLLDARRITGDGNRCPVRWGARRIVKTYRRAQKTDAWFVTRHVAIDDFGLHASDLRLLDYNVYRRKRYYDVVAVARLCGVKYSAMDELAFWDDPEKREAEMLRDCRAHLRFAHRAWKTTTSRERRRKALDAWLAKRAAVHLKDPSNVDQDAVRTFLTSKRLPKGGARRFLEQHFPLAPEETSDPVSK